MPHLLGIDLGTSSVKAVILDHTGRLLASAGREYPILTRQPGYAEQDPAHWWAAATAAVRAALAQTEGAPAIDAIGLSGQMHGVALVDPRGQPLGHAIIWPDQRSAGEVAAMTERIGAQTLLRLTGTLPATGFMGPSLLWLRRHQPYLLAAAHAALLPKDMLRCYLTGEIATDASDASATALFDITRRSWADEVMTALDLPRQVLPPVLESAQVAGRLRVSAAEALRLTPGIPVAVGCADQAAQMVGNGLFDAGGAAITLGTGGQVITVLDAPLPALHAEPGLHTFCHAAPGRWYVLGAMLAAGLSLRWLRDVLALHEDTAPYETLAREAAAVPPGAEGLLFLPYLVGERSPLMDPHASGTFVGLGLHHTRGHLARAVLEGVAFALRHIVTAMTAAGVDQQAFLAAGSGLVSPVWRGITADVIGRPLRLAAGGEHTAIGAALIGGIAAGIYPDYDALRPLLARPIDTTMPDAARAAFYDRQYALFAQAYPALRQLMHDLRSVTT